MKEIFDAYKNFVFVGESGCGKTELALNFARELAGGGERVTLFDMDQTKPLFRARNAAENEDFKDLKICWQEQLLDTPIVPPAVRESILDESCKVVIDVGGNDLGVHMIGQYKELLNKVNCAAFFVINPTRIWSGSITGISDTFSMIATSSGLNYLKYVINPNFGKNTTKIDVIKGFEKIESIFPELLPEFFCVPEQYAGCINAKEGVPILPIRRYCKLPWE